MYEDNALGKITDEQFAFLTSGYDDEKKALTKRIAELTKLIDEANERSADVKRFVALVRRYTEISELAYENLHELPTDIYVFFPLFCTLSSIFLPSSEYSESYKKIGNP